MSRPYARSRFRHAALTLAGLGLAVLVAGCAGQGSPNATVEYREGTGHDRPLPSGGAYTVQRGDTIYSVARQYNLSVRALIDANGLQPPYQLTVGQMLLLSTNTDYVVQRGDTLLAVTRRTGVPFSTLARMNELSPPYVLKVGQRLKMPAGTAGGSATAAAPVVIESPRLAQASGPMAPPPVVAQPLPPPMVAKAGDKDKKTAAAVVVAAPPPPTQLAFAPPPPPPPPPPPAAGAAAPPAPVVASAPPPAPPPPEAAPAAAAPVAEQKVAMAAPVVIPPPPPKSGRGFLWPVKGQVIGEYGPTGKGQHNDGINIAVDRGTPVVASDDGVVAYSGNELRGFGNLLLIKHADGWMTAYAHNDALLVKRGDTVKRGQQIAKAGDTGGVAQPQLHFEVRHGTHAVDPMSFLKGGTTPAASLAAPPDPE